MKLVLLSVRADASRAKLLGTVAKNFVASTFLAQPATIYALINPDK